MRDYGKVHTSFWTSSTIRGLSEDARALAFYLLSCPHGTIAGVFRLPDGYACEDLQWDAKRVQEGFAELFQNGFSNRCETTKWVWISKHFDWNPPENPNQRKAIAKVAAQIPDDCTWKRDFMRVSGRIFGFEPPSGGNPSETVPQPLPNQEQEQEQEELQLPLSSGDDVQQCPAGSLVNLYHELMPNNPRCKVLNVGRRSAIRARWLEAAKLDCAPFGYTTRSDGLIAWRRFFEVCAESKFLTGQVPGLPGKAAFVADIDFIFSPSGFAKTLENKYHRDAS